MRAEHYAGMSRPAWEAVADATGIGPGTRVLDVACGSGEFGVLAAARGAPRRPARDAGLTPGPAGEVAVPYAPPDEGTLLGGLLSAGNIGVVAEHAGLDAVRRVLLDGSAPFRRADGSCLFRNTFRWVVGATRPNRP